MTNPERQSNRILATAMLVLLTMIWGGTFPATKAALEITHPMHFLTLRFWIAIIFIAPFLKFLRRTQKHDGIPVSNESTHSFSYVWRHGLWVGFFLFIGYVLQVIGMRYTTASRSGFFTGLLVIIAPLLAHLFRTSRTPMIGLAGIPIAISGVYLLAEPEMGGLNIGDLLTIACAFAFSAQMVTLEVAARKVRDPWGLTFVQMVTVGAGSLIWCLIEGEPFCITSEGWLCLGYTALFGSLIAGWLQTRFQPLITAGHASLIYTLEPVFAMLFAWILLNEGWSGRGIVGAVLILVAMGWSSISAMKSK